MPFLARALLLGLVLWPLAARPQPAPAANDPAVRSPSSAADVSGSDAAGTAPGAEDAAAEDAETASPSPSSGSASGPASDLSSGPGPTPMPAAEGAGTIVSRDVVARVDDTFAAIARREFGTVAFAPQLAEFNALALDAPLVPGDIVRVPILVPARGEAAETIFVKGEVTRGDAPLERGDRVVQGDIVATGPDGFASLRFATGATVNLQPGTTAVIARLACLESDDSCVVELDAQGGELRADVEARERQTLEFRIGTPYASAAVRGTVFGVLVGADALRTAVTDGDVVVAALGERRTLAEGFGSLTREGEPPGEPVALLRAPLFRTVPTRAAPGDTLAWFDLRDAVGYDATLALDADGVETFAALPVEGTAVTFPAGIAAGDYYVTLRGLDRDALPGFAATTRLGVAVIDPDVAPVATRLTRENREFLVEVVDPASDAPGFEIQVATTPDFADPLAVDVAGTGRAVLRLDADTLYARARTLLTPTRVSAFGPVSSSDD